MNKMTVFLVAIGFIVGGLTGIFLIHKYEQRKVWKIIQETEIIDLRTEMTSLELLRQNKVEDAINVIQKYSCGRILSLYPEHLYKDNNSKPFGIQVLKMVDNYKSKYPYLSGNPSMDSIIAHALIWARSK